MNHRLPQNDPNWKFPVGLNTIRWMVTAIGAGLTAYFTFDMPATTGLMPLAGCLIALIGLTIHEYSVISGRGYHP